VAILIEGISVVVRCRAIMQSYIGGQSSFMKDLPNKSLCADGELASVAFMTPADAKLYVDLLEKRGLKYFNGSVAVDLVVVDQNTGFRAPCNWASFGKSKLNNQDECTVSVCESVPTTVNKVVIPNGWTYENSLTARGVYISADNIPSKLKLFKRDDGVDIYIDENTGQKFYVGHLS